MRDEEGKGGERKRDQELGAMSPSSLESFCYATASAQERDSGSILFVYGCSAAQLELGIKEI